MEEEEEKYYIKIGKFYILSYELDENSIETDFINCFNLVDNHLEAFLFTEKERWVMKEKIVRLLELESMNPEDIVTFEANHDEQ